ADDHAVHRLHRADGAQIGPPGFALHLDRRDRFRRGLERRRLDRGGLDLAVLDEADGRDEEGHPDEHDEHSPYHRQLPPEVPQETATSRRGGYRGGKTALPLHRGTRSLDTSPAVPGLQAHILHARPDPGDRNPSKSPGFTLAESFVSANAK